MRMENGDKAKAKTWLLAPANITSSDKIAMPLNTRMRQPQKGSEGFTDPPSTANTPNSNAASSNPIYPKADAAARLSGHD